MTQIHSAPTMPFSTAIALALTAALPCDTRTLAPRDALESYAFRILETPLVYLLNEHRIQGRLLRETPEEQYLEFTENAEAVIHELQERFPNHWQRWLDVGLSLANSYRTIQQQIVEDAQQIAELLGAHPKETLPTVLSIRPMGDIHPQGVVCEVLTSLGTVYYKPRHAGNELFISALASWIGDRVRNGVWMGLEFPRVAACGDHSWVAPVIPGTLTDLSNAPHYYRRAGHLLGLAFLVNLTDLHHENIIATATQPVPVDLETLMSVLPRSPLGQSEAIAATLTQTTQSSAATGLLPLGSSFQELGGDVSGLAAHGLKIRRRVLDRQGRSDMRYIHVITKVSPRRNLPTLLGNPVPPESYVDDIIEGFATVLRTVIDHREELLDLIKQYSNSIQVRVIARMTNDYAIVLTGLSRIGGNNDPDRLMTMLRNNAIGLADTMVASEEAQLRRWAVPHFWAPANERVIRDPGGQPVGELDETPANNVITKIMNLTRESVDHQSSLIRMAFRNPAQIILPLSTGLESREVGTFEEFEQTHFTALNTQAITAHDGTINWPTLAVDEHDQLTTQPMLGGLYRGVAGVAELLSIARKNDPNYRPVARSLLTTLKTEIQALWEDSSLVHSYYHGPAGRLAAAARLATSFGLNAPWISHGHRLLLTALDSTPAESHFDVMEGPAGMIIALRDQDAPYIRALCRDLGHQLRIAASDGWGNDSVCPLTRNASFAHDSGGMGTAVLIAADHAEDFELVDSWREAWNFENTFKVAEGWRDARSSGEVLSTHWCHGLAGIALARITWLQTIQNSPFLQTMIGRDELGRIQAELSEVTALLARELPKSGSPSLCHGIAGGALVLDLIGRTTNQRRWRVHARDLVTRAGATLSRCSWLWGKHDIRDFGIFTGPGGLILARHLMQSPKVQVGPLLPSLSHIKGTS